MYIQITTRCNMACGHCCFACRPGAGVDMTRETFVAACKLARNYGQHIALGGGEPTIHPLFWEFLGVAMKYHEGHDECPIFLATNGSMTEDALALCNMAKAGVVQAVLSVDDWHDPIDEKVIRAFQKLRDLYIREAIRSVSDPMPQGSAYQNDLFSVERGFRCCCNEVLIAPDGCIYACGCKKTQLGTVFDPQIPSDHDWFECPEERAYSSGTKKLPRKLALVLA